jgi:hypothetical protein
MFQFLNANQGGEWKMAMASDRDGLVILIADFHRANVQKLRLNPAEDGTGGVANSGEGSNGLGQLGKGCQVVRCGERGAPPAV